MKRTLPKNSVNYINITPDKLPSRKPTGREKAVISNFIKKYNRHNKVGVLITISMGFAFAFLCIYNNIFDFYTLLGCSVCFIVAFAISRKILPSVSACQYFHIGQLQGVWSLRNNSSHNRIYYFDVIFPDTLTRIKNVNCTRSEYSISQPDDYILTFSFDGKTAYGCIFR